MNNKSVLITGGTGSFGNEFVSQVLKKYPKIKRLVIFSRDELKQYNMQKKYPKEKFKQLRFFIGDIRDKNRLNRACENIDIIIHAAALKQVETAEYNPTEFIETNIKGSQNIIEAAIQNKIKKVVALSTDKAAAPINLYGATKMCSDKLFIAANNYVGNSKLNFVVVRYGNVLGSRGSVLLNFQEQKINGVLKITDPNMTRFSITLAESVKFVLKSLTTTKGGEILIPKLPSYNILKLAKAVDAKCKIKIIGIRPGEKIHEEMITSADSYTTVEYRDHYRILPKRPNMIKNKKFKYVKNNFSYNSLENNYFLNVEQLKKLIKDFNLNEL